MTKYKRIFSLVSLLFLIIPVLLVWRISVLFTDMVSVFPNAVKGSELVPDAKTASHEATINLNNPLQIVNNNTDSSNFGHYETIDETIARIKRDVQVTGALIGARGQEAALLQIEGMPDRSFKINTQLMDGFIITGITENRVILKNQTGNEIIFLDVGK